MKTIQCSDLLPMSTVNDMLGQIKSELLQMRDENSELKSTNYVLWTVLFLIITTGSIYILYLNIDNTMPATQTQFNSHENSLKNDTGESKQTGIGKSA